MRLTTLWVVMYALLIIGLSSIPGHSFPSYRWLSQDKVIHLLEYLIFAMLISQAMLVRGVTGVRVFMFTVLLAGVFGVLDELYQLLIPGRDASYQDWVADVIGVCLGSWIYLIIWKYLRDQATTG